MSAKSINTAIIIGIICAVVCNLAAGLFFGAEEQLTTEMPLAEEEYLVLAINCDEFLSEQEKNPDLPKETKEKIANIRQYQLANLYGEILNNRAAKNMPALIEYLEQRKAYFHSEAEAYNALAWQSSNNARSRAGEDYAAMMEEYVKNAALAGENTFEEEYYQNLINLMTDETVKKGEAPKEEIAALKSAVTDAFTVKKAPLPWEIPTLCGFMGGALIFLGAAIAAEAIKLHARQKKQRKAESASKYGEIVREINFR